MLFRSASLPTQRVFDSHFSVKTIISCLILILFISCGTNSNQNSALEHPNFAEHIAPLLFKNCSPCHRPGSAAPFNLLSYADAKRHARTIQITVSSRIMPPWPADPEYVHFREEKVLSDEEILLFKNWIEDGCPEGETAKTPSPPVFPEGSLLGTPDLVLKVDQPFSLPGDNTDKFMMMKIPYDLGNDTFIRAIEIIPGNKKLVHHINAHLIQYEKGAKKNMHLGAFEVNTELMNKQEAFHVLDLANDDGSYPMLTPSVTNYLPGVETAMYPDGIGGYRVKKNGILLLDNIHYGPSPVPASDQTLFNVFFSPLPPKRPLHEFILGTSGISAITPPLIIQPGSVSKFITSYTVPEDISIVTVNPHMHLLGKSFFAFALTPQQDTIRLIRIPRWDFRWQYFYTFRKIVKVPAGSTIYAEGIYDNTEQNPLNPFHPPQLVSEREGSMRTTDEMFQLIVTWMPYKEGDENISLDLQKK
ncbi:MAG TPA: hypothetical protein PLU53_12710 [Bacteroidia bacterium]|nr:hypothetical protein [Bacteroidia bacterium]